MSLAHAAQLSLNLPRPPVGTIDLKLKPWRTIAQIRSDDLETVSPDRPTFSVIADSAPWSRFCSALWSHSRPCKMSCLKWKLPLPVISWSSSVIWR